MDRKYIKYVSILICITLLMQGCGVNKARGQEENIDPMQEDTKGIDKTGDTVVVVNEVMSYESNKEDDENTGVPAASLQDPVTEDAEITEDTEEMDQREGFYISEITDDLFSRIYGKSFKEDCILDREDLRYLHVLNKDINGVEHEGEMIVNVHIAEDVLEILKELYDEGYPIEKIRLVDEYDADDELSMEDNNSSSFNFRFVPRTKKISKHGRGLAIDINPLYNPYITRSDKGIRVEPVNAGAYADRNQDFEYKIEKDDLCYRLFISHGFEWGGEWKNSKDYQHFEIPDSKIKEWYP